MNRKKQPLGKQHEGKLSYIALIIAAVSLVISVFASFKEIIFPSNISVLRGTVTFIASKPPSQQPFLPTIFSLVFLNKGYQEDIIEWVAIKAINNSDQTVRLLTALKEVDMQRIRQNATISELTASLGPFVPFVVPSKSSVAKSILFNQDPSLSRTSKYPLINWTPGKYSFEIYIKKASASSSVMVLSLSAATLDSKAAIDEIQQKGIEIVFKDIDL